MRNTQQAPGEITREIGEDVMQDEKISRGVVQIEELFGWTICISARTDGNLFSYIVDIHIGDCIVRGV